MGAVFYIQIDFLGNLWYTIKNNYGGLHGETQISHTATVGAGEKRHHGGQEDNAIFFQAMCILNGSRAGKNSFPLLKNTYAFTILADTRSV